MVEKLDISSETLVCEEDLRILLGFAMLCILPVLPPCHDNPPSRPRRPTSQRAPDLEEKGNKKPASLGHAGFKVEVQPINSPGFPC
jgi:hypothetical protein